MATVRRASKETRTRSAWLSGSICQVLLVLRRFPVQKPLSHIYRSTLCPLQQIPSTDSFDVSGFKKKLRHN